MTDTPLSDDVVERVAKAIAPVIDQTDDAETVARAALEAARYGEMVEALRDANAYLHAADIGHPVRNRIDALLSSIGASHES